MWISAIFLIALVVRDTDGSAFITKAEFDSLKNNFQAQIDNYNSSIDSKIDGSIASYLAGIRMADMQTLTNLYNNFGGSAIKWCSKLFDQNTIPPEIYIRVMYLVYPNTIYLGKQKFDSAYSNADNILITKKENQYFYIMSGGSYSAWPTYPATRYVVRYVEADGLKKIKDQIRVSYKIDWALSAYMTGDVEIICNADFSPWQNSRYHSADCGFDGSINGLFNTCSMLEKIENTLDLKLATLGRNNTNKILTISQQEFERCTEVPDETERLWATGEGAGARNILPSPGFYGGQGNATAVKRFGFRLKNIRLFKYDDYTGNASKELHFSEASAKYPIKIYEGIPMAEIPDDGSLTITKIVFSTGGNKYIAFNNGPFDDNDAMGNLRIATATGTFSELVSGGKYYYSLGSSTELKNIVFENVTKNTTIYVKMYDSNKTAVSEFCTMDLAGDIIFKKDN